MPAEVVGGRVHLAGESLDLSVAAQGPIHIGVRPEALAVSDAPGLIVPAELDRDHLTELPFKKRFLEDLGPEIVLHGHFLAHPDIEIRIRAQKSSRFRIEGPAMSRTDLQVWIDPDMILAFDADGARLATTSLAPHVESVA